MSLFQSLSPQPPASLETVHNILGSLVARYRQEEVLTTVGCQRGPRLPQIDENCLLFRTHINRRLHNFGLARDSGTIAQRHFRSCAEIIPVEQWSNIAGHLLARISGMVTCELLRNTRYK